MQVNVEAKHVSSLSYQVFLHTHGKVTAHLYEYQVVTQPVTPPITLKRMVPGLIPKIVDWRD